MKYKIIKIAALLAIMVEFSSCFNHVRTDRQYHGHNRYRHAGNYWQP